MSQIQEILAGDRLALARLLTQIENNTSQGHQILESLFSSTGRAHIIGVTGAPGTGKSALVNQMALLYRQPQHGKPKQVGIVAVDPSSPFTGGAILGDRVRMRDLAGDKGVFIRSMASRGSLGGLASTTSGVVQALDAAGFDVIIIETVGAGQAEVDIARLAYTTLVVEAPGMGDEIQAIKAGILEIADVLVVNKFDRPGAENTENALRSMLQLAHPSAHIFQNSHSKPGHSTKSILNHQVNDAVNSSITKTALWFPPILRSVATEGQGISEIIQAIGNHRDHLLKSGEFKVREHIRLKAELDLLVREMLIEKWRDGVVESRYEGMIEKLVKREISPREAAKSLLTDL
jgi:LAO/AO transport system kinase